MLQLKSIELTGIVTYKNVLIDLRGGLTLIRGENRSGKSLTFSSLSSHLWGAHPLEKKGVKTLFKDSGSWIKSCWSKGSSEYEITQVKKASGFTWTVRENGVDLKLEKGGQEWIKGLFPQEESVYYCATYLTGFKSHLLLSGTPSQRYHYFKELFLFFDYDRIKNCFRDLLKAAEKETVELTVRLEDFSAKGSPIKPPNLSRMVAEYKQLREDYASIKAKEEAWQEVPSPFKGLSLDALTKERDRLTLSLKESKAELMECREEHKNFDYQTWLNCRKRDEIVERWGDLLKVKQVDPSWNKEDYREFKGLKNRYSKSKLEAQLTGLQEELNYLLPALKKEISGENCPLCGSDLNNYHNHVKEIKSKIKVIKAEMDKVQKKLRWADLQEIYNEVGDREKRIINLDNLEDFYKDWCFYKEHKMAKSGEFIDPDHLAILSKKVDNLTALKTHTETAILITKNYGPYKNEGQIAQSRERLLSLKYKIEKTKQDWEHYDWWLEQKSKSEGWSKRLVELKRDVHLYKIGSEAFGDRGLKQWQIERFVDVFKDMLNKNAHFIYPETIKFDLELKNNNLNIWATRNGLTSDVNLLCGSESRCFQLLCLLVLNKILGYEQRCSFAVLDEMESGLDERSKNIFVGSYINELLQYVQDVIIITPQSHQDFFVEGARELMVKKQKQTSWIEEL